MRHLVKLKSAVARFWRAWGRDLAIVLAIMIPFRSSIADWNHVPTGSMKPTIVEGDRVFVNKMAYDLTVPLTTWRLAQWGNPQRGDVVVFYSPSDGERLVKRVIGLPGDIVAMRDSRLFLNGEPADYGPPDPRVVRSMPVESRRGHIFARERLGSENHPVMITPRHAARRSFGPVEVPQGQYLVLGDNRDNSADSRFFGFVDRQQIVGKASAVVVSFNRENFFLPRRDRWLKNLP